MTKSPQIWQPRDSVPIVTSDRTVVQELMLVTTSTQIEFTLNNFSYKRNTGSLIVIHNGKVLASGKDYIETTDTAFILVVPALIQDEVLAIGFIGIIGAGASLPVSTWLGLSDTIPATFVGSSLQAVRINSLETGLEFYTTPKSIDNLLANGESLNFLAANQGYQLDQAKFDKSGGSISGQVTVEDDLTVNGQLGNNGMILATLRVTSREFVITDAAPVFGDRATRKDWVEALVGTKEDLFAKNSGFNLGLGVIAGTVSEGDHTHTAADIGLGNVDNTSDLNKPISTATQTALDVKIDLPTAEALQDLGIRTASGSTNLLFADRAGSVEIANAGPVNLIIDDTATTNYPIGMQAVIVQADVGQVSIVGATNVTIAAPLGKNKTSVTDDAVTIYHSSNNVWRVFGGVA